MDIKFEFINTSEKLNEICKELQKEDVLGIDIECENNLHYYGIKIAIIQISSKDKNYIVDIIEVKNLEPLKKIFENPKIQKIFHDVSFDLRMLKLEMKCDVKNIFDTQLAALFLGKTQLGLGNLLEEYFNISKESKFQMADWVKRPISKEMLQYAIKDTVYLIKLKEILTNKIKSEGKLSWLEEEFKSFENKDWEYHQGDFLSLKGIKSLSNVERSVAYELYKVREKFAKIVNRPIHFIIGNKMLLDFSKKPMKNIKQWQTLKGVHPVVKQKANEFVDATLKGLKKVYEIESPPRKKFNQTQIEKFTELNEIKEKLAKKYNLPKHVIMSKEQEKEIVLNQNLDCLFNWQRELVKQEMK